MMGRELVNSADRTGDVEQSLCDSQGEKIYM